MHWTLDHAAAVEASQPFHCSKQTVLMSEMLQVSVLYTEFDGTLRPWAAVPKGACIPAISALNDLWRDPSDATTPNSYRTRDVL